MADSDDERPNAARMYDYFLGGAHNFAVDRRAAEAARSAFPALPATMRAGRAFLRRAVHFLLDSGVDQFLDLGSGIPTVGNVHEIAQLANVGARVVYVDVDPIAVAHSRTLLADEPATVIIDRDVRDVAGVLADPQTRDTLDFDRPIGLLFNGVLHFVPDADDPAGPVTAYRQAVAPGSYLVIGHATGTRRSADGEAEIGRARKVYSDAGERVSLRSRDEIAALFTGTTLVPPGVVEVDRWRPDEATEAFGLAGYAGVARID
jgi:hypothetical protein